MIIEAQIDAALEAIRTSPGNERQQMRAALEAADRAAWCPIDEAPKNGIEVLVYGTRANIPRQMVVGHFTQGGGDEQPPYGPDWFYYNGYFFDTCPNPTKFRLLPPPPEDAQ